MSEHPHIRQIRKDKDKIFSTPKMRHLSRLHLFLPPPSPPPVVVVVDLTKLYCSKAEFIVYPLCSFPDNMNVCAFALVLYPVVIVWLFGVVCVLLSQI